MPYENLPGYGTPMPLPSGPIPGGGFSNLGYMPTGGSSGSGMFGGGGSSSANWGQLAGAGAGLIASAFAPTIPDIRGDAKGVQQAAKDLGTQGKQLTDTGQAALAPVLKYFSALLSGNPADIMAATAPDRARVIDQYDAARKTAAQFAPRGGGQASGNLSLKAREASDLAMQPAAARANAANAMGAIGQNLTQAGMTAEEQAINQLSQVLGPLLRQEGMDQQSQSSTWESLGSFAMMAAMAASSRTLKEGIRPLSDDEVADRLAKLPIATWQYKGQSTTHIGPMAEDFHRAFGVGDGKTLALVDVMGVLLAAERSRQRRLRGQL
jgi:hypothetical protein